MSKISCVFLHEMGDILDNFYANYLRGNINIYLHFMSFLHNNKTQVVEIPPPVRQGPSYST